MSSILKSVTKISTISTSVFVSFLLVFFIVLGSTNALSGSEFKPSNIIDNAVFYNSSSMTPEQIQSFLNSKVPSCDTSGQKIFSGSTTRAQYGASQGNPPPYTCLKDYSQTVPAVINSGSDLCKGSIYSGTKSAATIIHEVSKACGINPQVLIVLLQKEQSLVTDDWPWSIQYRSATGYGCPDTAPCDSEFYGFFNQVYQAAKAFKRYEANPSLYNYRANRNNYIQYNPNTGCGGSNVYIENQATANLYIYTPYQPNQAALNNLYGIGDNCSAYGNRNFWRIFNDWFGSTKTTTEYAWRYIGQEVYTDVNRTNKVSNIATMQPGTRLYARVYAQNIGTKGWSSSSLRLATSGPKDRNSNFYDSNTWINRARAASLKEASVGPGATGTFEFSLLAPSTANTYYERFNLVAENITWLNDLGLYFTINVVNPGVSQPNKVIPAGGKIGSDKYILSTDKMTHLKLSKSGNLEIGSAFRRTWTNNINSSNAKETIMQNDGNLVIYSASGQPIWNTGTGGNPGSRLEIQSDGNVVIYSASNSPIWSSNTPSTPSFDSYVQNYINKNSTVLPGQKMETASRNYSLQLQDDGNLVLYNSSGKSVWSTNTYGKQVKNLCFQSDGNLVLYGINGTPVWSTYTHDKSAGIIVLQPDGNLVIYNTENKPVWNSKQL